MNHNSKQKGIPNDSVFGLDALKTEFAAGTPDFDSLGETTTGTSGDDDLLGTATPDTIDGGAGNDLIAGGDDADTLDGESGNDELLGEGGDDTLTGGSGDDELYGGAGDDTIHSGSGDDQVKGGDGDDTIHMDTSDSVVTAFGDGGDDTIHGGTASDGGGHTLRGGAGNDRLIATNQNQDYDLRGDDGEDTFVFGATPTTAGSVIHLKDTIGWAEKSTFEIDDININWNDFKAVIDASRLSTGFLRADFDANGYTRFVNWSSIFSNDTSSSHDIKFEDGQTVTLTIGNSTNNTLTGSANDDFLTVTNATLAATLDGGAGDDLLGGRDGDDILLGNAGADRIIAGEGDDQITGGTGDDRLEGRAGEDLYFFNQGDGVDTIFESSPLETDYIVFGTGITADQLSRTFGGGFQQTINFAGTATDKIHIDSGTVEMLRFADGSELEIPSLDILDTVDMSGDGGADAILGDGTANKITGGGGDDELLGGAGNDTINGGNDDDRVFGGEGNDTLEGDAGADFLHGGAGDDTYKYAANDGDDLIVDTSGTDEIDFDSSISLDQLLFAEPGSDDLEITFEDIATDKITIDNQLSDQQIENLKFSDGTTLDLTDFDNWVFGDQSGPSQDTLIGSASADVIFGLDDVDTILAGDGDDVAVGGQGADSVNGQDGNDRLYGGKGDDGVNGQDGDDYLYGGDGDDSVTGGLGDDFLYGNAGADTLFGDDGTDRLEGGAGDDNYFYELGDGHETILDSSSTGSDKLVFDSAIDPDDLIFADVGTYDLEITFSGSAGDKITLLNHRNSGATNQIETAVFASGELDLTAYSSWVFADTNGSNGVDDIIIGTTGNSVIDGLSGDDQILGQGGADTLDGGAGNDEIYGGAKGDTIEGGDGADTIYGGAGPDDIYGDDVSSTYTAKDTIYGEGGTDEIWGGKGDDTIYGGTENDDIEGGDGDDILYGDDGNDAVRGNDGDDIIYGGDGNDVGGGALRGDDGNDIIYGGAGFDVIKGGNHNDILYGGDGDDNQIEGNAHHDILYGGDGLDKMWGGTGFDWFIFENAYAFNDIDIIKDFVASTGEGLDLSDLLGSYDSATDDIDDFVKLEVSGSDTLVKVDADGGADNYVQIATLENRTGLDTVENMIKDGNLIVESSNLILGHDGDDTITGSAGVDVIFTHSGTNTVNAGAGNDRIYGGLTDTVYGEDGDDYIDTGGSADTAYGGNGNDEIYGGTGTDTLYGDAGADTLYGENAADTLYGGDGKDTLTGGTGADDFVFESASAFNDVDDITDFSTAQNDAIDISDVLEGYDPLTDDITEWVQITDNGVDSTLAIDANGTTGGTSYTAVATILGVTGLTDEALLENNGHLITS